MILRRLLTITILLTSTIWSQAQQINAVPDYVFRNQMSVGRNAVTDTAAYFSIGPRYGATKGFMPPIVGDTATFSSGKRNGLLIFSVQKNKFLYWDSVRVQWSDMAGSSGAYIVAGDTSAMLAPYLRKSDTTAMLSPYYRSATASAALALKLNISDTSSMLGNYVRHAGYGLTKSGQSFLVDTLNIATRAWRQKGLDSLAALEVSGSGTTNYVAKFTAGSTIGNSQIFDNGTNVGIGTASPGAKFHLLSATGTAQTQGDYANNLAIMQGASRTGTTSIGGSFATTLSLQSNDDVITAGSGASIGFAAKWNTGLYSSAAQFGSIFGGKENSTDANLAGYLSFATRPAGGNPTERLRITSGGDVGISQPSLLWTATNRRLLELNGTSQSLIGLNVNSLKAGYIWQNGNDMTIATENAGYIQFGTNGSSDRMRIFSNGRVGINTITDAGYQLDINGTLRSVNGANFATTSGNVGIGTASPGEKLDVTSTLSRIVVTSTTNSNNAALYFNAKNSGGTNVQGGVYFIPAATPYLSLSGDNSGTHLNVTSAGNVGIGTASPATKLHVADGSNFEIARFNGTSTGAYIALQEGGFERSYIEWGLTETSNPNGNYLGLYNAEAGGGIRLATKQSGGTINSTALIVNSNAETLINTSSDAGDYKLQVAGNIYNTGSAVLAATSGNVGIGGTSPQAKLDVYGAFRVSSATFNIPPSGAGIEYSFRPGDSTGYVLTFSRDYNTYRNQRYFALTHRFSTSNSELDALFINASQETLINTTTDAGDYKLQVAGNILTNVIYTRNNTDALIFGTNSAVNPYIQGGSNNHLYFGTSNTPRLQITTDGELLVNTSTDAGDYKLQVVGNARIGTGKLDIASNTTFGLGVARSGTSEVAGQIYNSNGILYLGAESSAGGQIFSGSSAYAAVIGSGANYPLQFAANNITRATMTTNGNFMIGFPTDTYFYRLQVNGSIFSNNQIIAQNAAAQLNIDSSTNISPLYISNQSLTGSSAQGIFYGSTTWNTTGNPSLIDLAITNTASGSDANYIKISDGSNIFRVTKAAEVVTAAPTGGSIRKWKLGEAATVSPTSPNRTIRVEIDGVVYYLHAKTTND